MVKKLERAEEAGRPAFAVPRCGLAFTSLSRIEFSLTQARQHTMRIRSRVSENAVAPPAGHITGRVDKELLVRNEYLAAENRILRAKIKCWLQLSDGEKRTLAEIAHRLGRKALAEVAVAAKPDTILRWFRKLVARKFDGSACRQSVGRPRVEKTIEDLIVRMAQENPSWGYDRMVGALANLGHSVSDQTVGNVLKRNGIAPAPQRKHTTRWRDFIRAHMEVLAGTDLFTVEVFTLKGLVTYYVLFFIQLETRRVPGRDHAVSGPAVDGAAGAKRNGEGLGLSGTQSLPAARSRRQVLSGVSRGDPSRQGQAPEVAGTQSEPKCVCRALGTLGERGMPVAVDLFRRAFVASRLNGVYRPFPPRTESSGQREEASVSPTMRTGPTLPPGNCAMQRTTRWLTAILRGPSSMNTGSDYYFDRTRWSSRL